MSCFSQVVHPFKPPFRCSVLRPRRSALRAHRAEGERSGFWRRRRSCRLRRPGAPQLAEAKTWRGLGPKMFNLGGCKHHLVVGKPKRASLLMLKGEIQGAPQQDATLGKEVTCTGKLPNEMLLEGKQPRGAGLLNSSRSYKMLNKPPTFHSDDQVFGAKDACDLKGTCNPAGLLEREPSFRVSGIFIDAVEHWIPSHLDQRTRI